MEGRGYVDPGVVERELLGDRGLPEVDAEGQEAREDGHHRRRLRPPPKSDDGHPSTPSEPSPDGPNASSSFQV